jgi:hypothetical protein
MRHVPFPLPARLIGQADLQLASLRLVEGSSLIVGIGQATPGL